MINSVSLNYKINSKLIPLFIASGVVAAVTALFYYYIQPTPPLPSGATISNIHQDGNYGDQKTQVIFNQWFAQTVKKTVAQFHQTGHTAESLLIFISRERRAIAKKLEHNNANLFGRHRRPNQPMHTHITRENRYAPYLEKCMDLFFQNRGPFQGLLPGESDPISLSSVDFRDSTIAVIHANFTHSDYSKIIQFLQQTTTQIFSNENISKKELFRLLGTMHWWLAQTMLFLRGSACITEIFIQAIASANGFPSTQWKPNTMPDLEAILSEHDDFVNRYEEILLLT